jgi:hypothetical protein
MAENLPTFEEMRARAFALLGTQKTSSVQTGSRGTGPTAEQGRAASEAKQAIAQAKAALDRAGR